MPAQPATNAAPESLPSLIPSTKTTPAKSSAILSRISSAVFESEAANFKLIVSYVLIFSFTRFCKRSLFLNNGKLATSFSLKVPCCSGILSDPPS